MNNFEKKSLVILSILIAVLVCIGLTGCGNNKNKESETKTNVTMDSNTEDTDSKNINNNQDENQIVTEEEALSIGNDLYSKANLYYFGDVEYDSSNIIDEKYYKITNIEDVKDKFTEQGFKQYIEKNDFVKEIDGSYYRIAADRGGDIFYIGNELQILNINETEIVFKSIEKYIVDGSDLGLEESQITNIEKKEYNFIVKKVDGKWRIEEFTLPL